MKTLVTIFVGLLHFTVFSQIQQESIFGQLSEKLKNFSVDTAAVPNDQLSANIRQLRKLKGGFNINEAIDFKLEEAKIKNEISETAYLQQKQFWNSGNGKRWLDNAVIWIYREKFNASEVKQLVKFYKTAAGKKMGEHFPLIMIESVKAAEWITEKVQEKPK